MSKFSLFGCRHVNLSFPLTPKGKKNPYVVCLECGKEFPYDWGKMKVVAEEEVEVGVS